MKTSLDHLPEAKQEQVTAIAALLQAEAPVEMVILFGSYARGDWVEDPENGYFSDFDILAVVATEELARDTALWTRLSQRAQSLTGQVPVRVIAHDIKEVNQEIRHGQYFFVDILRQGVKIHDSRRYSLAGPKALEPADRLKLGLVSFRYWFASANEFWRGAGYFAGRGLGPHAAFLLHQSVERYFAAAYLVFTAYKPKSHNIEELANETATFHPALAGALPRSEPEDAALFALLKRAYIEARYSKSYRITAEELRILRERVHDLAGRVREACLEKLVSFCGPEHVGDLPDVPPRTDVGDLPEPPSLEDPAAFQAWRDAVTALSFERGEQQGFDRGDKHGFDRGKQAGIAEGKQAGIAEGKQAGIVEGQLQALWSILAARGLPVDPETRAKVEACQDPAVIARWIARATTAPTAADVFTPDAD